MLLDALIFIRKSSKLTSGAISSQSIFCPHLLCVISAANIPPTIFLMPGKYDSFPQIALATAGNCAFDLK